MVVIECPLGWVLSGSINIGVDRMAGRNSSLAVLNVDREPSQRSPAVKNRDLSARHGGPASPLLSPPAPAPAHTPRPGGSGSIPGAARASAPSRDKPPPTCPNSPPGTHDRSHQPEPRPTAEKSHPLVIQQQYQQRQPMVLRGGLGLRSRQLIRRRRENIRQFAGRRRSRQAWIRSPLDPRHRPPPTTPPA